MKSIKVKQTINTGDYENIVVEIEVERYMNEGLHHFLDRVQGQLRTAIAQLTERG